MKQETMRISIEGLEEAVKTNQLIQVKVRINNSYGYVNYLEILFNQRGQQAGEELKESLQYDEVNSTDEYSCFSTTVQFNEPGYRTYVFRIVINGEEYFIKSDGHCGCVITTEDYPFFETFVYEKTFTTPDWVKGGIMYQIYIDTFNFYNSPEEVAGKLAPWGSDPKWMPDEDGEYRNNRFFGGNLEGVIQKLSYLKELGVTIIYFTPIFKSVSSNRYDTVDYEKIDEMVGNWQILKELCDKAHELDMHIVLDCVFNHCNPENELFKTQKDIFTGNFWWGYRDLAEFRMDSENYRNLLKKWLNLYLEYVDGVRLDVADNLPDDVLKLIRTEIKKIEVRRGKEIYLLGEVWKHAIKGEWRRFLYGDELDSVMNYQFTDAILRYVRWGDCAEFEKKVFCNILPLYPKCAVDVLMNPLSTHDIPRYPNVLTNSLMLKETYLRNAGEVFIWDYDKLSCWYINGTYRTYNKRCWEYSESALEESEKEIADRLRKLAVVMQYTLPGIPSIFAGDELGVTGLKDPFNRVCMPWQKAKSNLVKEFYIEIGKIRTQYRDIFAEGKCKLTLLTEKICIYERISESSTITCVINRTNELVELQEGLAGKILFSVNGSTNNVVKPYDAILLIN